MSKSVKIRKGVNVHLKGTAEKVFSNAPLSETFAIKPTDFHGVSPKLTVKVGDEVKAGTPLFYDKYEERLKITAPVSGEIVEINRGAKRKLLDIKILADKEIRYESFKQADPNSLSREEVIDNLLSSGLWPFIKQRPYDVIANPADAPKAIFISAFNSAPLAPDNDFIVHGQAELFQTGLDAIRKLTTGTVHLNVNGASAPSEVFTKAKGVQLNQFSGPHPAGNVGIHIHHLDPMNKGEVAWVVDPQAILSIGRLFKEGKYDASRCIALAGACVKKPRYYKTMIGTSLSGILDGNLDGDNLRIISGNVLTGSQTSAKGYLGFYSDQVTVVPEGDSHQFFGWIAPNFDKFSVSRTFFSWLTPKKEYNLDTNLNGEERAFVMSGQYEKVFPMDIYPVQLLKSIMIEDIEQMENLGIYEVAPEDFALCEFVCTSKINAQQIVREGLDLVRLD